MRSALFVARQQSGLVGKLCSFRPSPLLKRTSCLQPWEPFARHVAVRSKKTQLDAGWSHSGTAITAAMSGFRKDNTNIRVNFQIKTCSFIQVFNLNILRLTFLLWCPTVVAWSKAALKAAIDCGCTGQFPDVKGCLLVTIL